MTRMDTIHGIQKTLLNFIYGGVFDRFPGPEVVSAEHDAGLGAPFRPSHRSPV